MRMRCGRHKSSQSAEGTQPTDRLQRHAIGIDLSIDYAAMAQRRLEADCPLFTEVPVHPVETEIADLFSVAAD
jgi:hypothetical protein